VPRGGGIGLQRSGGSRGRTGRTSLQRNALSHQPAPVSSKSQYGPLATIGRSKIGTGSRKPASVFFQGVKHAIQCVVQGACLPGTGVLCPGFASSPGEN